jgi:hypothetical protein
VATTVGVLAVGLVASGCSSSAKAVAQNSPTPKVSASPTVDPKVAAAKAALMADFDAYWRLDGQAARTGNVNSAAVQQISTADAYSELERYTLDYTLYHVLYKGTQTQSDVQITGLDLNNPSYETADLSMCMDSTDWHAIDEQTGQNVNQQNAAERVIVEVDANTNAGKWYINNVVYDNSRTC